MASLKVSLIVPVYNVSEYIVRCWDSIRNQSYKNLEILFVDDCGTDDSIAKLEACIASIEDNDVKILHHSRNRGLSAARNTGLEAATGDYIYFLDSDDNITSDCIESLIRPLCEKEYDIVVGDYSVIGVGGYSPLLLREGALESNSEVIRTYSAGDWYVMAWNKLCRREFLLENELFFKEGLIHEDVLWSFKVACKAENLYVVKKPIYNYYVRSSSIMTSMSIEKDANVYVEVFDNIVSFAKKEEREYGRYEYALVEGKKAGILYSLLQKKEVSLYNKIYRRFRKSPFANPYHAYRKGIIGIGYLVRDFHYLLPESLGSIYKRLFYLLVYKLRGRKVEGSVWG